MTGYWKLWQRWHQLWRRNDLYNLSKGTRSTLNQLLPGSQNWSLSFFLTCPFIILFCDNVSSYYNTWTKLHRRTDMRLQVLTFLPQRLPIFFLRFSFCNPFFRVLDNEYTQQRPGTNLYLMHQQKEKMITWKKITHAVISSLSTLHFDGSIALYIKSFYVNCL